MASLCHLQHLRKEKSVHVGGWTLANPPVANRILPCRIEPPRPPRALAKWRWELQSRLTPETGLRKGSPKRTSCSVQCHRLQRQRHLRSGQGPRGPSIWIQNLGQGANKRLDETVIDYKRRSKEQLEAWETAIRRTRNTIRQTGIGLKAPAQGNLRFSNRQQ